MSTTIQRRVDALETSIGIGGGGESCPKCNETLIVIRDAITREFRSARSASGEEFSAEELSEREARCPRCHRKRERGLMIHLGGHVRKW